MNTFTRIAAATTFGIAVCWAQEEAPKPAQPVKEESNDASVDKLQKELQRLKIEKETLAEKLAIGELKLQLAQQEAELEFQATSEKLQREATLAKARAETLINQLKAQKAAWELKNSQLEAEIELLETTSDYKTFAKSSPQYLEKPLLDDGTLVVSDRRISLNGVITSRTADEVTSRIHFYNNRDAQKPIFIIIDDSPGGSVMAGYRILKAMEGSSAPIHVVVKSFAASMAATITTLAEESYAYPNALIMHHQISSTVFGNFNLTEQKEYYEESKQWWDRLATPISKKMGISNDEFIEKMYAKSSSGDWFEFATEAQKLHWVNHIVSRIQETSALRHPDKTADISGKEEAYGLKETVDSEGRRCMILPRLNPKDVYFLHNPDFYYRLR